MSKIPMIAILVMCLGTMTGWAEDTPAPDARTTESGLSRFLNTSAPGLAGLEVQTDVDEAEAKRARAEEQNKALLKATQSGAGAADWRAKREEAAQSNSISPEEARRRKGIEESFANDLQEKDANRIARNVHLWRLARLERIMTLASESGKGAMASEAQELLNKEKDRYEKSAKLGGQE